MVATLEQASLSTDERQALDRAVAALETELGEDLLAVWLYGSRARAERLSEDSDVDLLVVVSDRKRLGDATSHTVHEATGSDGGNPFVFSTIVKDPRSLAEDAAIESLYLREVERDRIVLWGGEKTPLAPLEEYEAPPLYAAGGIMTRSFRWLERARGQLAAAEQLLDGEGDSGVIASSAYYAALYAARTALSEEGRVARKHAGTWHLMRELFVATGRLDGALVTRAQELQKAREGADYDGWTFVHERNVAQVDDARRFVEAIEELLGTEPET